MDRSLHRVVVVDSDPNRADSAASLLSPEPHFVVDAVDSIRTCCLQEEIDIAIVDLARVESEGLEGVRKLRASLPPDAIVVAIIGLNDTALGIEVIRAEAQDCIVRESLNQPTLVRSLSYTLERHRLRHGMQALIENNPDGMLVLNTAGEVLFANRVCQKLIGKSEAELKGQLFGVPLVGSEFAEVQLPGDRHAQMRVVPTQWRGETAWLASLRDITQDKLRDKQVWAKANFDELTRLPNRALFVDRLDNAIMSSRRTKNQLGLMFIDLDRLKWVNDTHGHSAGDNLLRETAQRLKNCVRETDTVARLGGDEFVILLAHIHGPQGTERVAKKVLDEIARPYKLSNGREISTSASVGIALFPDNATDPYGLLNSADTAMYQAKAQGKNGYAFYSREMHETALSHMSLERDLRDALTNDEVALHYQPVVDLATGQIQDVEALLRWTHPTKGLLDTETIIEIASHSRLLATLDDWVLKTGALQACEWQRDLFAPPRIWVNLASDRRSDGSYVEVLANVLESQGLDRSSSPIGVELTERCCIDESVQTRELLAQMQGQGVKLAIDDFLSSSSSINHLRHLPIDVVKIDREAVSTIAENVHDRGLVESLISMAHSLDLRIVAEGIETREQLNILKAAGCDAGQGYLFSKAVSATDLEPALASPGGYNI